MKLAAVMGTRPEIIKMAPIVHAAKEAGVTIDVIFTGQHREMGLPLLQAWGLKTDVDLEAMVPGQSLSAMSARVLSHMDQKLSNKSYDAILVQGDTTSAFIGAYWGFLNHIPVAHVEAGLRTNDLSAPFPEEGNRQLIGRLAKWHFAPTADAKAALLKESITPEQIEVTGNTAIDALMLASKRSKESLPSELAAFTNQYPRFVLLTAHRRENIDGGLDRVFAAVKELAMAHPEIGFIFPVHLNPAVGAAADRHLQNLPNLWRGQPLDYFGFVQLLSSATVILTDSGGIQEEGPTFGAPVFVMREKTERPEGLATGHATLVGTDHAKIVSYVSKALKGDWPKANGQNPYGDGNASKRIIESLKRSLIC